MGFLYLSVVGGATAMAFASPQASYAAYAVIVVLVMGFSMIGRWESVMVWSSATDGDDS
jgi:hypothetical protein